MTYSSGGISVHGCSTLRVAIGQTTSRGLLRAQPLTMPYSHPLIYTAQRTRCQPRVEIRLAREVELILLVVPCLAPRYLAIVHPLVSRVQQSKARAKRILLVVWAGPCVLAAPFLNPARAESDTLWSEYGSISRRSCLIMLDPRFRRGYYLCLFLLMYLLPLLFIGWTCGRIARCLLRGISLTRQGSLRRQEANRRKVGIQDVLLLNSST